MNRWIKLFFAGYVIYYSCLIIINIHMHGYAVAMYLGGTDILITNV